MGNCIRHKGALRGVLFEELHAGRRVVKQILYPDGGAHSSGTRLTGDLFPALNAVDRGKLVHLGSGGQLYTGHAGNRCQCFTAEAKRMDVGQIVRCFNFAGGVADKRRGDIFCLDAGAVIADLD